MFWFDGTKSCSALFTPRGKQIVICLAGSSKGFVENSLLLCGIKLSKSYADYHDDMSEILFEDWFENTSTPKLSKESKVVVEMVDAK